MIIVYIGFGIFIGLLLVIAILCAYFDWKYKKLIK